MKLLGSQESSANLMILRGVGYILMMLLFTYKNKIQIFHKKDLNNNLILFLLGSIGLFLTFKTLKMISLSYYLVVKAFAFLILPRIKISMRRRILFFILTILAILKLNLLEEKYLLLFSSVYLIVEASFIQKKIYEDVSKYTSGFYPSLGIIIIGIFDYDLKISKSEYLALFSGFFLYLVYLITAPYLRSINKHIYIRINIYLIFLSALVEELWL